MSGVSSEPRSSWRSGRQKAAPADPSNSEGDILRAEQQTGARPSLLRELTEPSIQFFPAEQGSVQP